MDNYDRTFSFRCLTWSGVPLASDCTELEIKGGGQCTAMGNADVWHPAVYGNSANTRICPEVCYALTGSKDYTVCSAQTTAVTGIVAISYAKSSIKCGGCWRDCTSDGVGAQFVPGDDSAFILSDSAIVFGDKKLSLRCSAWV